MRRFAIISAPTRARRSPFLIGLALIALASCTRGESGDPGASPSVSRPVVILKIAFLQDLSSEEAAVRSAPAFQGAKLAFDTAALGDGLPVSVELISVDTGGDAATAAAAAREILSDPAFVGAIGAPSLTEREQSAAGDLLDRGGLPTLTLSPLGPNLSSRGWTAWRRTVADVTLEGRAIAAFVDSVPSPRRGACVLGDGSSGSKSLLGAVAASTTSDVVVRWHTDATETGSLRVAQAVSRARCGTVVWGGSSTVGGLVRRALHEAGARRISFVGGDAMKDPVYLAVAGRAGLGTVAACPCADLSTATDFASQRFIQDYQADFGVPPGAFAAEAWDAAGIFVRAFRAGGASADAVRAILWGTETYRGLANTYAFQPDGELTRSSAPIRLYRDEGGRWIPLRSPVATHAA
jgi:ABC-type branched-subunit amino acid transport system substrate-binding protein